MTPAGNQDLSGFSMLDLFRQEAETQTQVLNEGLLAIESDPADKARLESLMRAAHSIKGAARIVGLDAAIDVAHAIEDCFVAAQKDIIVIQPDSTDILLHAVDMLSAIAALTETDAVAWKQTHQGDLDDMLNRLAGVRAGAGGPVASIQTVFKPPETAAVPIPDAEEPPPVSRPQEIVTEKAPSPAPPEETGRTVRVSADNLNRMLGMIGEALVQTRWFDGFSARLLAMKKHHARLSRMLDAIVTTCEEGQDHERSRGRLIEMRQRSEECRRLVTESIEDFDAFARRSSDLADRLYRESVASRMRPFSDGVHGLPRMVRDLARELGKKVQFEILGQSTDVDREILDRLDAPLTHLLRNALDHGIESPEERESAGKPATGLLRLEARHCAGLLDITVTDDGRGIDIDRIRRKTVERGYCTGEMASQLTEAEVFDFLFLPGFSTAERVTEISGRGVGMDVVRSLAQGLGGAVHVESRLGQGARFHLQLPVTLSVVRALLAEIAGEPFALPLTRIEQLVTVDPAHLKTLEGRHYLALDRQNVGIVDPREVLELSGPAPSGHAWSVVVIGDRAASYGIIVDRFLGERKLVVRPLDSRLGRVRDVNAVSLMEDGSPVIILDVDDMARSIDILLTGGRLKKLRDTPGAAGAAARKRVLVADDSITVREMERRILENRGYEVDVAVDGMDGWSCLNSGHYDLVVSDVDMPRMNGIDFVRHIRGDAKFRDVPVVIVSYKDSEIERMRGLEAGANYYLTKSSFHDETFVNAVVDLIGEP